MHLGNRVNCIRIGFKWIQWEVCEHWVHYTVDVFLEKLFVRASNVPTVTKKKNKSLLFKFFINNIISVIKIQLLCSSTDF